MKKISKILVFLGTALLVSACANSEFIPEKHSTTLRGDKPSLLAAQELVMPYLKRRLKDFDSLKDFQILSGPHPTIATLLSGDFEEAWMICVEYNAKNSYGGYIGIKTDSIPLTYTSTGMLNIPTQENWLHFGPKC